eukprot:GHVR01050600.1.p1 GENE.GHVR01050600.1~~GHVR01050600.1.p1  ORF type:complete len:246 (+),score=-10.23 GHVR01050600.1:3713-4450(+)
MLSAVTLALFFQQSAFVGHDLGHNSVVSSRMDNYLLGGFFGTGIGIYWWKLSHNTHHLICNSVNHDPDIQLLPLIAVSNKLFKRFYSTFHDKFMSLTDFGRLCVSYQHILFYPIMAFGRFNLYFQAFRPLCDLKEPVPFRTFQIATVMFFFFLYGSLLMSLPTAGEMFGFLLLSHCCAGILHVQITISHYSMSTFKGISSDNWVVHQMLTTMNVDCPKWMDWFHGGLQFQIEHHLFPRLPRFNLR